MNQIIKTFLGVFLILLMCSCCIGMFAQFLHVMEAQNLHAKIVKELEESDYYPDVLRACCMRAQTAGCRLEVTLYQPGKTPIVIQDAAMVPAQIQCETAKVELKYALHIFGLQEEQTHILSAYTY